MIRLRDYQEDLISRTRGALRDNRRVVMQAPTGAGKTAVSCVMMKSAMEAGKVVWFIVHRVQLVEQTSKALWKSGVAHGLIVPSKAKTPHPVQVCSVLTVVNRLDKYPAPDLIIIDEAHRSLAASYEKILDYFPDAFVVGLTATPSRTDGRGLGSIYSDIVNGPPVRMLIEQGYLSDYEFYSVPTQIDLSDVRTTAGEFNSSDLEAATDRPTITGDAVTHYKKHAQGRKAVVMCVTIKHAEHVAERYRAEGIKAEAIHSESKDREAILDRLENGDTMVLTSVDLLVEGTDIPIISCVQWLRPTQSLVVWMQGCGRGLRTHPAKDHLVILDHVGNYARHLLPCSNRDWSLESKRGANRRSASDEETLSVQVCKKCYFAIPTQVAECPKCGAEVEVQKSRQLEETEGELERIKAVAEEEREKREARAEQGKARQLEELVRVGMERKMRRPDAWAANVFAARQGRKADAEDYTRARALMVSEK